MVSLVGEGRLSSGGDGLGGPAAGGPFPGQRSNLCSQHGWADSQTMEPQGSPVHFVTFTFSVSLGCSYVPYKQHVAVLVLLSFFKSDSLCLLTGPFCPLLLNKNHRCIGSLLLCLLSDGFFFTIHFITHISLEVIQFLFSF